MEERDNYSNKIYIENTKKTKEDFFLYFSNNCKHCMRLLDELNKNDVIKKLNMICIDNRLKKDNVVYLIINNDQLPLPPMINCVPMMTISPTNEILKGKEIYNYFMPLTKNIEDERNKITLEPDPFSLSNETIGEFGVTSDNFSFWNTSPDELSASGNGGIKQLYNYSQINSDSTEKIYTPSLEESDNKNNISLEQLQKMREEEL